MVKKKRDRDRNYRRLSRRYIKRNDLMQELASERIEYLFQQALFLTSKNLELANRYVEHARRIAMGAKVKIPTQLKRYICHGCKKLLVPGSTMRFRMHHRQKYGSFLSVTCLQCGYITRYIIKGRAIRSNEMKTNQ